MGVSRQDFSKFCRYTVDSNFADTGVSGQKF